MGLRHTNRLERALVWPGILALLSLSSGRLLSCRRRVQGPQARGYWLVPVPVPVLWVSLNKSKNLPRLEGTFPDDLRTKIEPEWPRKRLCSSSKSPVWRTPDGRTTGALQMFKILLPTEDQRDLFIAGTVPVVRHYAVKASKPPLAQPEHQNGACTLHDTG